MPSVNPFGYLIPVVSQEGLAASHQKRYGSGRETCYRRCWDGTAETGAEMVIHTQLTDFLKTNRDGHLHC